MPRPARSRSSAIQTERANVYKDITAKIIAELEGGRLPWVQPWATSGGGVPLAMPRNASTQRGYSGINVLILWGAAVAGGYSCQSWLTFRQALTLGGSVRKGERGTCVVYADRFIPEREKQRAHASGEDAQAIAFLKRFTLFSVDQCDGLPAELVTPPAPVAEGLIAPNVEALIQASGVNLRLGGDSAYYSPAGDYVQVPRPEAYYDPINWHRTALHELGHWSGHPARLARDLSGRFGSKSYAQEELVAEMCAAFCCATLGITPTVRHADYIGAWLEVMREDNKAIVRAASAASRAADYLLAFRPSSEAPAESEGDRCAEHMIVDA